MPVKRAFISFDFDHDEDLRNLLAGQAKHPDTPFEIKDRSLKEPLTGDWKDKVRRRMHNVDVVIVICGEYTHTAAGVAAELIITREASKPYFLLWGAQREDLCQAEIGPRFEKDLQLDMGKLEGPDRRGEVIHDSYTRPTPHPAHEGKLRRVLQD